jgi:ankyrin repeat protein
MSEFTEAIRQGDAARVEALLASDPGLLQQSEDGVTPILLALYHGRSELAQWLAARGGAVSFGEACALGDLERVRRLLDGDPSLLDARSPDGYPPLGLSIFFRHPDVARFLIERGADVNAAARNANCVAPVHAAAAVCDHDTMRLLLEHGADPHARQQLDYTALHGAASRGDVPMAELLLAHGADLQAKGSDGLTPADIAKKYGKSWL